MENEINKIENEKPNIDFSFSFNYTREDCINIYEEYKPRIKKELINFLNITLFFHMIFVGLLFLYGLLFFITMPDILFNMNYSLLFGLYLFFVLSSVIAYVVSRKVCLSTIFIENQYLKREINIDMTKIIDCYCDINMQKILLWDKIDTIKETKSLYFFSYGDMEIQDFLKVKWINTIVLPKRLLNQSQKDFLDQYVIKILERNNK